MIHQLSKIRARLFVAFLFTSTAAWTLAMPARGAEVGFEEVDLSGAVGSGDLYEMAEGMGGGLAAADFDNDGDVDIFLPNQEGLADRLLRNQGDGTFLDEATQLGVSGGFGVGGLGIKPRSRNALWLDFDGDRRLDLLVIGDCWNCPVTVSGGAVVPDSSLAVAWSKPRLFRQLPDSTFVDATAQTRLDGLDFLQDCVWCLEQDCPCLGAQSCAPTLIRHLGGLAAGDLDGDELPDVFIGHWRQTSPVCNWPRNGRILISDAAAGIYRQVHQLIGQPGVSVDQDLLGHHWQTIFHDFNQDGRLDVLSALDGNGNTLWLNLPPPGTDPLAPFVDDALLAGLAHGTGTGGQGVGGFDMGIGIGDYDNDGAFDFYLTNTNSGVGKIDQLLRAIPAVTTALGTITHSDQIAISGILPFVGPAGGSGQPGQSWGWGVTFLDADLDGWSDLAITNGFSTPPGFPISVWPNQATDPSLFFLNNYPAHQQNPAQPIFLESSAAWSFNDTYWGSALAAFDFDRDGDPDLAQTTQRTYPPDASQPSLFRLLRNRFDPGGEPRHWLVIRPRLTTANTHALGAVVRVSFEQGGEPMTQSRLITAGTSFMTQEPAEAHFGLGPGPLGDVTVTIEWPGGHPPSQFIVSEVDRVITYGWCSVLDLVPPYGKVNRPDGEAYLALFEAGDPKADLAAPFGVLDEADQDAARALFEAGCPTATVLATDLP